MAEAEAATAIDDGDHTDERIARIQGRRRRHSYPTPRSATVSRFRLVSSSLHALARARRRGSSSTAILPPFLPSFLLLFFLPFFFSLSPSFSLSPLSLSRSKPKRSRARATL